MELSVEELKQIEEYAGLCFLPSEIAKILEKNTDEFVTEFQIKDSELRRYYDRGALINEALIRKSIFELAKSGSSASQSDFLKLINNRDKELMKNGGKR